MCPIQLSFCHEFLDVRNLRILVGKVAALLKKREEKSFNFDLISRFCSCIHMKLLRTTQARRQGFQVWEAQSGLEVTIVGKAQQKLLSIFLQNGKTQLYFCLISPAQKVYKCLHSNTLLPTGLL